MKTKNIFKFIAVLFIAVSFSSCVEDGDYTIPTLGPDANYPNLKSLSELVDLYNGSLINFDDYIDAASINEITTYGYVVSNDRAGNFFKTIIIQDKPENPTIGVEVRIDDTNLNARYNVGRKIYITLSNKNDEEILGNGLAFTKRFDTYQIGIPNSAGNGVDRIGTENYIKYIDRSSEVATLVPTIVEIANITDAHINTLVKLEDMQALNKNETFANPDNTFSANRDLKNCATEETIIMRTSGFASFKNLEIPQKRGSVTAILNKFRSDYQLFVRDLHDFDFTQDRCDPLFDEGFANFDNWRTQNVIGDQVWETTNFGNPGPSAKISGFQSTNPRGPKDNEDWLISKAIDLSAVSGVVDFSFDSVKRFGGDDIEVFYSTNYNGGNPNDTTNTWTQLTPVLDTNTGSWTSWTSSGILDVSAAVGGNLFVAFKYTSTTSGAATFEIDNVKVSVQ